MSLEDRALAVLRALIKELDDDGTIPKRARELRERASRAGVRIMDEIVSAMAKRRVRTRPRPSWERAIDALRAGHDELAKAPARVPPSEPAASEAPGAGTTPPVAPSVTSSPVEPTPAPEVDDAAVAALPIAYAGDRLVLVARDPEWGHAYWNIDVGRVHHALSVLGGGRAFVRLLDGDDGTLLYEGETWAERGRYYLRFPEPDCAYAVELVIRTDEGRAVTLARSGTIIAPPGGPRPAGEPRFVDLDAQRAVLARLRDVADPPRLAPPYASKSGPRLAGRPRRTLQEMLAARAEAARLAAAQAAGEGAPSYTNGARPGASDRLHAGASEHQLDASEQRL